MRIMPGRRAPPPARARDRSRGFQPAVQVHPDETARHRADETVSKTRSRTMLILEASPLLTLSTWVPFVTPAPLWDYWWALLLPLLAAVAVVYKCTKRGR